MAAMAARSAKVSRMGERRSSANAASSAVAASQARASGAWSAGVSAPIVALSALLSRAAPLSGWAAEMAAAAVSFLQAAIPFCSVRCVVSPRTATSMRVMSQPGKILLSNTPAHAPIIVIGSIMRATSNAIMPFRPDG